MKILEIDTCDKCYYRAKFSDYCLHTDTFNREIDKSFYPAIPGWCPLENTLEVSENKYNNPCYGCEHRMPDPREYINVCLLDESKGCVRDNR